MANEFQIAINITHQKAPKIPFNPGAIQIDQAGVGVFASTVTVGTTAETLAFTDITTPHLVVIWNLDDTNFVEFGVDDGGTIKKLGKLRVGKKLPAIIPWRPGSLLSLQADMAPCKVYVAAYEE